ncbi:MAG TPA: class I adenylate-forming enzyme family protein [bacterium]
MAPAPDRRASLSWYERFAKIVATHPHQPALVTPEGTLTYRELHAAADQWRRDHAGDAGRVVVVHVSTRETLAAWIGAWTCGRSVALLQASTPAPALQALRERLALPIPSPPSDDPEDREALVLSTSGTTGAPKLVVLAQRAITTMMDYLVEWYARPRGTTTLVATPLAMGTAASEVLMGLASGWVVHLYPEGTPVPVLHEVLRRERIQFIPGTASFYRVLLGYAPSATFPDLEQLRSVGEVMEPQLLVRLRQTFPNARRVQTFGATDAWRVCFLPMDDPRLENGGVGVPLPHCQVRIRPMQNLPGPEGELLLRGPIVALGHIGPTGAYEGMEPDGWRSTRDVAFLDTDGCLYLRGRIDALFKSGGQWVNPQEVERVLSRMPGVAEVRCFPEPHALLGQAPVAEVVVVPGNTVSSNVLRAACAEHLSPHQIPREFRMVRAVARGASGKKQRR